MLESQFSDISTHSLLSRLGVVGVGIKNTAYSVQVLLQLPTGTELGKIL